MYVITCKLKNHRLLKQCPVTLIFILYFILLLLSFSFVLFLSILLFLLDTDILICLSIVKLHDGDNYTDNDEVRLVL